MNNRPALERTLTPNPRPGQERNAPLAAPGLTQRALCAWAV